MNRKHIMSISGGKDSTAMLLLSIEQGIESQVVFADTGNEHQMTYDYVNYLQDALKIDIQWVKADFSDKIMHKRETVKTKWYEYFISGFSGEWKLKIDDNQQPATSNQQPARPNNIYQTQTIEIQNGIWIWTPARKPLSHDEASEIIEKALSILKPSGNPFLDLCLWKGRFPSTKARFCSHELKREPIQWQVMMPLLDQYDEVYSWQGVRADESFERSKLLELEQVASSNLWNYRPILKWTAQDCFDMHKKHNINPNPLYTLGMGRVGCMPCIHARKGELSEIAKRFPEEIQRIAEWENLISYASRRQSATFFTSDDRGHGIHSLVEWSKTSRGGNQYNLLDDVVDSCSSIYGLCE